MIEPLSVLILEDSPTDAKLIVRELGRTGQTIDWERLDDRLSMREALARKHWDLIISDWSMPSFSATEALAIVKEMKLDSPFIIVSGTVGDELAVEAMRAGAHDYVLKDRLARLGPAVERELREHQLRAAHRQAEESLRVSEARFARLSESGIVGICIADVFGKIHEANPAYLDMIGYSRDELFSGAVGWGEMTPPEWRDADEQAIARLKADGVAHPWEKELIRKDGSRVPILIGVAMLDYPKCIAFQVDLTERRHAEEELRRSEERHAQSQKMEAIGSLAGAIAHDFNNLLTVILSYSTMLTADLKSGDPMRADLDEIHAAAERAADLTRQLLAFSRRQVLRPRLVNLNEIVVQTEKMLRRLIGENIELVTLNGSDLGNIMVDPGQIEQVIMNLVVNARDAMPDGGKLTIETSDVVIDEAFATEHATVAPGRHVVLAVTDTGTGMDEATKARIFEPFFTTKEQGKGTGLGLSTVFGIVRQSAGSVWVYSEPENGTSFRIYFPHAPADARDRVYPSGDIKIDPPSGSETILLVEDEVQVRNLVRTILRREGYHVLEAQSAGDALLICEQHSATIHLLLTDVVMPRMSGRHLAERLGKIRPAMKVLYMSGYTDDAVVHHGILDSNVAFLQKPITPAMLTRKVRQVLSEPAAAIRRQA